MSHESGQGDLPGRGKCRPWKHVWKLDATYSPTGKHAKLAEKMRPHFKEVCENCPAVRFKNPDGKVVRLQR